MSLDRTVLDLTLHPRQETVIGTLKAETLFASCVYVGPALNHVVLQNSTAQCAESPCTFLPEHHYFLDLVALHVRQDQTFTQIQLPSVAQRRYQCADLGSISQ